MNREARLKKLEADQPAKVEGPGPCERIRILDEIIRAKFAGESLARFDHEMVKEWERLRATRTAEQQEGFRRAAARNSKIRKD